MVNVWILFLSFFFDFLVVFVFLCVSGIVVIGCFEVMGIRLFGGDFSFWRGWGRERVRCLFELRCGVGSVFFFWEFNDLGFECCFDFCLGGLGILSFLLIVLRERRSFSRSSLIEVSSKLIFLFFVVSWCVCFLFFLLIYFLFCFVSNFICFFIFLFILVLCSLFVVSCLRSRVSYFFLSCVWVDLILVVKVLIFLCCLVLDVLSFLFWVWNILCFFLVCFSFIVRLSFVLFVLVIFFFIDSICSFIFIFVWFIFFLFLVFLVLMVVSDCLILLSFFVLVVSCGVSLCIWCLSLICFFF